MCNKCFSTTDVPSCIRPDHPVTMLGSLLGSWTLTLYKMRKDLMVLVIVSFEKRGCSRSLSMDLAAAWDQVAFLHARFLARSARSCFCFTNNFRSSSLTLAGWCKTLCSSSLSSSLSSSSFVLASTPSSSAWAASAAASFSIRNWQLVRKSNFASPMSLTALVQSHQQNHSSAPAIRMT